MGAVIGWVVLGGDSDSADDWPVEPQFQHSFESRIGRDGELEQPRIVGTADDLYIVEPGDDSGTVFHYVDGKLAWQTAIDFGSPWLTQTDGDRLIINTQKRPPEDDEGDFEGETNIVRLNPADGATMWSIKLGSYASGQFLDGRYYADTGYPEPDQPEVMIEYDVDTGAELKRLEGDRVFVTDDGFITVDIDQFTVQLHDLDFQPVGGAVRIEAAESQFYAWVVEHTEDGWFYYSEHRIVALTETGNIIYECPVSIDETQTMYFRGDNKIVASSFESIEVFQVDGTTCKSVWSITDVENAWGQLPYVVVYDFPGEGEDAELFVHDAAIDVLDWDTGKSVATGEDDAEFDAKGRMLTFEGNFLVVRDIESGDELWRVEGNAESIVVAKDEMVALINPEGDRGTVEVYSADGWAWNDWDDLDE